MGFEFKTQVTHDMKTNFMKTNDEEVQIVAANQLVYEDEKTIPLNSLFFSISDTICIRKLNDQVGLHDLVSV